jgi:hypothetical protein
LASSLAGVSLFASSYGILLVTRRARKMGQDLAAELTGRSTRVLQLESELRDLSERLSEIEHRKLSLWDCSPEQSNINLNRRGQVLRLARRGDSAAQIASTLGLSKGEVMLIVKVHEISKNNSGVEDLSDSL